ncbi:MAG: PHP domain-containing protein, partial [Bacillota bacterium]|nr:PHP domain-containing protein [Bacillota bacterium]
MRITSDYHTHTFYSDGKGTMEQNIRAAIAAGLSTVGISDHGYAHLGFGIKYDKIQYMREELDQLKEKYRKEKIEILLGIECNILDDQGSID